MKKYAQNWLWAIIFFWICIFSYLVLPQEIQVTYPQEYPRVVFQAYPVDPRDLLRGDYVTLNYAFSRPDVTSEISDEFKKSFEELFDTSTSGDKVYLVIEVDEEKNATPIRFERKKPEEGLFLKGKIYADYRQRNAEVLFGIERYYVEEGAGREWEEVQNQGRLMVEVALHPSKGKALITHIFVNKDEQEDVSETESVSKTSFRSLDQGHRYIFSAGGDYSSPLSVDVPPEYQSYTTTTKDIYLKDRADEQGKRDILFVVQSDGSTLVVKDGDEILETVLLDDFFDSIPFDAEKMRFSDDSVVYEYSGERIRFQIFFTNINSTLYLQDDAHEIDVRDFDGIVFYSLVEELSENGAAKED